MSGGEDGRADEARILRSGRMPPVDRFAPSPGAIRDSGIPVPVENPIVGYTTRVTVTDKSQMILPADRKRKFLYIVNDDTLGNCRVSFGAEADMSSGIKLGAGGGGVLLDNHVPTAAMFIIGSIAANANVSMVVG